MKKIVVVFGLLSMLIAFAASAQAGEPLDRLKAGVQKVVDILADPMYKDRQDREQVLADKLHEVFETFFDFRALSMRSVGKKWVDFTDQQKDDFVVAFRELIEKTYLKKIGKYNEETVEYQKELIEGKRAMIMAEIVTKTKKIPINFRMVKSEDWMVYDISAEGVSLVKNYKTQFKKILTETDANGLIERIKDKIKTLDEESEEA